MKASARGFGLLDAVLGIALLSAGLLALLSASHRAQQQARELHHSQQAAALIDDLAQRMHLAQSLDASDVSAAYLHRWGAALPSAPDCRLSPCTAAELARHDLSEWGQQLADALPQGRFSIRAKGQVTSWLAVVVAWQAGPALNSVTPATQANDCPPPWQCLLSHIRP
jgi:Tfp pilus assembly protein PilV